jgi:hypothetical protein
MVSVIYIMFYDIQEKNKAEEIIFKKKMSTHIRISLAIPKSPSLAILFGPRFVSRQLRAATSLSNQKKGHVCKHITIIFSL